MTPVDARHFAALRDRLGEAFRVGLIVYLGNVAYRIDDRIAAAALGVLV